MSLALPRRDWALVVAGAVLLVLAYPPFHLLLPSFVCLVPAVWLIRRGADDPRPLRRRLVQGFWFGFLSNGLVLYWMIVALWNYTKLAALGYAATILVLGLFTAMLFALTGWIETRTRASVIAVFPVLWTALEWVVAHLGDLRFPWLGLGTSLTGYPTLVQLADVVGARGVTLLLVAANAALAVAWLARDRPRRALVPAGAAAAGVLLALAYGLVRERTVPLRTAGRVALAQPNVGYWEKWRVDRDSLVRDLLALSEEAARAGNPDLVIWPEAAVPDYFFRRPAWRRWIEDHARGLGKDVLVGGLHVEFRSREDFDYYNSAFLFDSSGGSDAQPVYNKQYLVPIVERVPFIDPDLVNLEWFGGFGEGTPGPVYRTGMGAFGVLICYESAFEDLSRDYRRRGADFLVNITNDAWFGRTSAPYQHAAHLVMRAIENRVGIARAANSGISEVVDPLGRTRHETELGVRTFVTADLVTSDARTLYTRWGDWVGGGVVIFALLLAGAAAWRRR